MGEKQKPIYRTIYVTVPMGEGMDLVVNDVQTGTEKIERNKGLFSLEKEQEEIPIYEEMEELVPNGRISDVDADLDMFSRDYEDACNQLYQEGYDIISVQPILRGVHRHEYNSGYMKKGTGEGGFGFG